jgi:hypothetical protein
LELNQHHWSKLMHIPVRVLKSLPHLGTSEADQRSTRILEKLHTQGKGLQVSVLYSYPGIHYKPSYRNRPRETPPLELKSSDYFKGTVHLAGQYL